MSPTGEDGLNREYGKPEIASSENSIFQGGNTPLFLYIFSK